ncbi:MAG TPA: 6-phosphofructokinase, partial [Pyrinomonadaceae bacterium]|nr:6-phosphofructokinase [Pyrinomonadaceae bacterium]
DAGWLAAASSEGGPDMILIPELQPDGEMIDRLIKKTEKLFRDYLSVVIVISEGIKWIQESGEIGQITDSAFGPRKLGGVVDRVMKHIERELEGQFDAGTPFGVRPHHTDYTPRSGSPCAYDLKLVEVLAERLGLMLEEGDNGKVPILNEVVPYEQLSVAHTRSLNIDDMESMPFPARDFYDADRMLTKPAFSRFMRTIMSGPEVVR